MIGMAIVAGWFVCGALSARYLAAKDYERHQREYGHTYVSGYLIFPIFFGLLFWPIAVPVTMLWPRITRWLLPDSARVDEAR